jgi:hypothetical protein
MKAFPTPTFSINDEARVTAVGGGGGMDLRDYFAAQTMQGLLSDGVGSLSDEELADWAYKLADAMMKAREA